MLPLKPVRENPSLPFPSFGWLPEILAVLGLQRQNLSLCLGCHVAFSPVCLCLFSSCDTGMTSSELLTSAVTLLQTSHSEVLGV